MSLSQRKRTRRIRRAWAAWWQPQVDAYNRKFEELFFGESYRRAMSTIFLATFAPVDATCEATIRPDPAKYEIGEYVVGVDLAAPSATGKTTQVTVERQQNDRGEWEVKYVGVVGDVVDPAAPPISRRGIVPFYESMIKAIGSQVLPEGYAIACDLGDTNKPLVIVDIKGMERALARDGGVKP